MVQLNCRFVGMFCLVWLAINDSVFITHGKSRTKDARLKAVRGQILTKLGLSSPPEEHTKVTPSAEDLAAYSAVKNEVQKQLVDKGPDCTHGFHDGNGYFAKSVVSLPLLKRTGQTVHYQDPSTNRVSIDDVNALTFDASQLKDQLYIERAELRINAKYFPSIPPKGATLTACLDQPTNVTVHNACSRVLETKYVNFQKEPDIALDVTDAIKERVALPVPRAIIKLIFKGLEDIKSRDVQNIPSGSAPYVLVWYLPSNRYHIGKHRRRRRALDSSFCNSRPKEKRCCLRSFYVDFQRDLKWTWIHAPPGFHANYCHGKCPFLWSSDNQTHHTSIMALLNSINPDAPSEPCCVARSYKPLVILHYENGQPKIEQLSNMAVTSCTCI